MNVIEFPKPTPPQPPLIQVTEEQLLRAIEEAVDQGYALAMRARFTIGLSIALERRMKSLWRRIRR